MLRSLTLHNLALFKKQDIEFGANMNVILGETGAGKSLIFDAINFVLALKTDKSLLRSGEQMMRVDAVFSPVGQKVKELLNEMEIEEEDELVISRTLHSDGKTSVRVNGLPCSLNFVKQLAPELVDAFLQHESLQILKAKNHLALLDKFCDLAGLKQSLSDLIEKEKALSKKIASLGGDDSARAIKKDFLEFQIKELENAQLKIGEDDKLDERIKLLQSAEEVTENLGEAIRLLEGGQNSVLSELSSASRLVGRLGQIKSLPQLEERLEGASIEIDDIVSELKSLLSEVDSDPLELERLDERRDKIRALKRKYGGSIEAALQSLEEFKTQLDELIEGKELSEKLQREIEGLKKEQIDLCQKMHEQRKQAALEIKDKLQAELADLGMKSTQFEVKFDRKEVSADGFDDVSFIFSANKGQQLKDLAKTASGGESSRIMLAFKNMFASSGDNKTLLFDEIDSGISGEVGNMMAQKLASIARRDQVITITHLPQVASAGDHFVKVEKITSGENTISQATKIEGKQIVDEIAHIIGGEKVTQVMLENARELYERGQKFGRKE